MISKPRSSAPPKVEESGNCAGRSSGAPSLGGREGPAHDEIPLANDLAYYGGMRRQRLLLGLCLLALPLILLAACSGDDAPANDAKVGDAPPLSDLGVVDAPSCKQNGFAASSEVAERDASLGVLFYTARSAASEPFDVFTVDFYFPLGATDGPHTFVSQGENLADCHTCVMLRQRCGNNGCSSKSRAYLLQAGTLEITAMGAGGAAFAGTLKNALFAEVTIDAATQKSTLVDGGATWCLPAQTLTATVTTP